LLGLLLLMLLLWQDVLQLMSCCVAGICEHAHDALTYGWNRKPAADRQQHYMSAEAALPTLMGAQKGAVTRISVVSDTQCCRLASAAATVCDACSTLHRAHRADNRQLQCRPCHHMCTCNPTGDCAGKNATGI
jgi:hypothetical protein